MSNSLHGLSAQLTDEQRRFLLTELEDYYKDVFKTLQSAVMYSTPTVLVGSRSGERSFPAPDELRGVEAELLQVKRALENKDLLLTPDALPVIKMVVIAQRRALATRIEAAKSQAAHAQILAGLESHLRPFAEIMSASWFRETEAMRAPQLRDFLTLEQITRKSQHKLWSRKFDEKFHILMAPELFLSDLDYYRVECDVRRLEVGVAFLDIDDFKLNFNKRYGEFKVDRNVLPSFMSHLEAHFFSHGAAYRFGGDEYAVILPNVTQESASAMIGSFQRSLSTLRFVGVEETISVSAGLCLAGADSFLTNAEQLERATRAKNFAKENGKNCLATFSGSAFHDDDLYIVKSPV